MTSLIIRRGCTHWQVLARSGHDVLPTNAALLGASGVVWSAAGERPLWAVTFAKVARHHRWSTQVEKGTELRVVTEPEYQLLTANVALDRLPDVRVCVG